MLYKNVESFDTRIYNLKDKLNSYIIRKSGEFFNKASIRRDEINTQTDFIKYKKEIIDKLKKCIGDLPRSEKNLLDAEIVASKKVDGVRIENVILKTSEGINICGNFYLPDIVSGKIPAILFQQGNMQGGRCGKVCFDVCCNMARKGNAVFVVDNIGQGERAIPAEESEIYKNHCIYAGRPLIKFIIYDLMSAIDYLETRCEIDAERIGVAGFEGAGNIAVFLSIFDKRIKAVAVDSFVASGSESLYTFKGFSDSDVIFGARKKLIDCYDYISCCCPMEFLITYPEDSDSIADLFYRESVEKLYCKEKYFYRLCGLEDNLKLVKIEKTGNYEDKFGRTVADFFENVFIKRADGEQILPDLSCGMQKGDLAELKRIYSEKYKTENTFNDIRKNIYNDRKKCAFSKKLLYTQSSDKVIAESYMWFSQENMPCYGIMFKNKNLQNKLSGIVICLWENGTDKIADHSGKIKEIISNGKCAFVVDLTAMGKCNPTSHSTLKCNADTLSKMRDELLLLGDSLTAIRLYDIIKVIELLKKEFSATDIKLYTTGKYGVYVDILKYAGFEVDVENTNPENNLCFFEDDEFADFCMYGFKNYI